MEIIIENDGLQGVANYEPLKAWALEKTNMFNGLVVTEETLSLAKADAADLRKIAKSASDYRIQIKKMNESKIEKTLEQLKEITDIFNKTADSIAVQVKEIEDGYKQQKKEEIEKYFSDNIGSLDGLVSFDKLFDPKWLNKGFAIEDVKESITNTLTWIQKGINSIHGLNSKFETEIVQSFITAMDMSVALDKKRELEEREEQLQKLQELQKQKNNETVVQNEANEVATQVVPNIIQDSGQEEVKTYDVRLYMTERQKVMFKEFVIRNGIKYTSVPKR